MGTEANESPSPSMHSDVMNFMRFVVNPEGIYITALMLLSLYCALSMNFDLLPYAILPILSYSIISLLAIVLALPSYLAIAFLALMGNIQPVERGRYDALLSIAIIYFVIVGIWFFALGSPSILALFNVLDSQTKTYILSPIGALAFIISTAQVYNGWKNKSIFPDPFMWEGKGKKNAKHAELANELDDFSRKALSIGMPGIAFLLCTMLGTSRHADITSQNMMAFALFMAYFFFLVIHKGIKPGSWQKREAGFEVGILVDKKKES